MPNPQSHYFEVVLKISEYADLVNEPEILHVKMPVWTPGSYLIREFARNILDLQAIFPASGKEAKISKVSKNEWTVETEGVSEIEIRYKVYAFELTVDTSYVDNLHAIINGASVFVFVAGLEKVQGIIEIVPFRDWHQISTGLERSPSEKYEFSFPDYDILIDSPIEIGNQKVHEFILNGINYEVSIFSEVSVNQDSFVEDVRKVVATTEKVFQNTPYDRYVFLVDFLADNSFGGLEHLNSTHCIAPILRLEPPQEYHRLLSLFSHEFFHAWNVKRMRPVGLGPFDYAKEVYTKSLWIAEGITSYYDDLLIRRAGIYSPGEYLEVLSEEISLMKSLPGAKLQSAQEASFDSWIKHYRQNENSPNVILSYYVQGAVIGWMLDMEIRKSTDNSRNLDNVMRKVYHDTFLTEGRGFEDQEFERACLEVGGSDSVNEIFKRRVSGRGDVDYDKYLAYSGLVLVPKKNERDLSFLGLRLKEEAGRAIVSTVLSNSPAEKSGVSANDEIIGINGMRMDKSRLIYYVPNRRVDEKISVMVARQGSIMQFETELVPKPTLEYRISKTDKASEGEKRVFTSWIGADWSEEIKYEEYRQAPSRANPLDYV
jgi:predicted metalloprotease with PDZ domain